MLIKITQPIVLVQDGPNYRDNMDNLDVQHFKITCHEVEDKYILKINADKPITQFKGDS